LIQARGYSATAAGAAYLPFTLVLGLLSRWSGGLLDRLGARGPLIAGPIVVAIGFLILASGGHPYGLMLCAMTVLGLGMAITVAPLTATVLNAVPGHRTGVASGVNNAVASVGGLLAIALLGSLALGAFDRALDRNLSTMRTPATVAHAVQAARGAFAVPSMPGNLTSKERALAHAIVADSMTATVRRALWIAALLALAAALTAAVTIDNAPRSPP